MKTKIIIFFLLLLLSSCGYEAIYSKKNNKNYNFSISKIDLIGDKEINLKIKEKLSNYILNQKDKTFTLKIYSTSKKIVLAKDVAGDATSFQNSIVVNVEILMNSNFKNNFIMKEKFNYNNNSNKFNLKRYEKDIKNNLAETATDKLIFKLSNIK